MPILNVQLVSDEGAQPSDDLAQRIADVAGEVLQSRPQGTWVKVTSLSAAHYAENGGTDPGLRPVFVSVLKRRNLEGDALGEEAAKLADAIGKACNRPAENVHIVYEPQGGGRIAFGGRLVERG